MTNNWASGNIFNGFKVRRLLASLTTTNRPIAGRYLDADLSILKREDIGTPEISAIINNP